MANRARHFLSICACSWLLAVSPIPACAAVNVLFITTNNGWLTGSEAGRKSQIEAYGFTVNTIWDGASQATFDAAFANNQAIYLSDEATEAEIGYKLRLAPIGIFSEHPGLADQIGFCSSSATTVSSTTINVTNNTHYITRVFATGSFTLASGACTVTQMAGTTASGAVILATVGAVNSVVAIDSGATLANTYNGNSTAAGRRVQFPLPVSANIWVTLSANTYTMASRMMAWAAGLDRALVGHWKLNEISGTVVAGSSDLPWNATANGTATWTSAVLNNGFQFNGATNIQATGLALNPRNVTLAGWANLTAADTGGAELISLGDHVYIRLDASGNTLASIYNGTTWVNASIARVFAGSDWHHFALVFDDDANTLKLYVDGVQAVSASTTSSISWAGLGTNTILGRNGNAGTSHDFTGIIDDVRVYNYALTASEVAELFGFIGHWKLAETAGTNAVDSTVFARNGTVNGGPTWSTDCGGTPVFDFDGASQYISVPNAANLRPTSMLSIAAWIRGDSWGSADDVDAIIRKGDDNPNNYQLAVVDGRVALFLDDGDSAGIRGNTVLSPGVWYHVAATWDGSAVRIYVNGQLDNSPTTRGGTIGTDTRPLYIGGRPGTDLFDGQVRDVRLYNRPLTAYEIVQLAGMLGHWTFAEGSGASAADSSGLGNNATLSGGASWTSNCTGNNNALLTNGAGGVARTNAMLTPPDAGTVAFWMRSSGTPSTTARLFGVGPDWEVRQSTDGRLSFDMSGDATPDMISTVPLDVAGTWYHVAVTFDSANDTYAIYVNGELNKSGSNSVAMVQRPANYLTFGTRTGSTEYWAGALRDFRIYSRRLCPTEIAELYGLVGHWKLDETSGPIAADSSGLGRNMTVIGTPTWMAGAVDNCLRVNGATRAEVVSLLGNPKNITLAGWATLSSADSGGAEVVSLGDYFAIRLDAGTSSRAFFYNGTTWVSCSISQTFRNTGWHHFAAVFNDDQDVCKLYVDGVEAASLNTTVTIPYGSLGTKTVIGSHGNSGTTFDFNGRLDDIRVYNRALCPSEIADLEASGSPFEGVRIIKWVEAQ